LSSTKRFDMVAVVDEKRRDELEPAGFKILLAEDRESGNEVGEGRGSWARGSGVPARGI
jgi:hypothetical protein